MLSRFLSPHVPKGTSGPGLLQSLLNDKLVQVVDVGARGGADERWRPFANLVEVIGFEPDPDEWTRLHATQPQSGQMRYLPYALGATPERRRFYICRQPGCSGLLPPNDRFVAAFAPEIAASMQVIRLAELDVVPLDVVTAKEGLHPDCLKIDVQGAELEVLHGARDTLASVKLLELEVEFNPQYLGQPLFADVDIYLRNQGFVLLGLRRSFWRRREAAATGIGVAGGQIVHGDALYFNERLLHGPNADTRSLATWLLLFAAYRQHDFALEILSSHPAAHSLSHALRQQLARALDVKKSRLPRTVRTLLGPLMRGVDHHVLRQWVDDMRRGPAQDWHDPDFF